MDDQKRDFLSSESGSGGGKTEFSRQQEWRVSQNGLRFDLHDDIWPLTSKMKLNVSLLHSHLCAYPTLLDGAIRTLAHMAENYTAEHCEILMRNFAQFLDFSHPTSDTVSETDVVNFRDFTLRRDGHDGNGAQALRPFLTHWSKLGYPGITTNLVERMKAWRLSGYEKYLRVNLRKPNEGPLETDEQRALQLGALAAYEEGRITTDRYALYRLFDLTGRRREQLAQLKWKDMDDSCYEDATPPAPPKKLLLLKIPRIKAMRKWREHFRAVPLTQDEWNLLLVLRMEVTQRFDKLLESTGLALQKHDRRAIHDDLPMFPGRNRLKRSLATISDLAAHGKHGDAIALLRQEAASDAWESSQKGLHHHFDEVIAAANANNRVGEPLTAFPTRLRYTLLANLERLGCPPTVIAFNLDHDTLQSLPSYTKNGADRATQWSKATLARMERLAGFYAIKVVDSEADAVGGDDPENSRLLIAQAEGGATCAIKRGCSMGSIPRACYNGCPHFQPWVDGPHEAFLEELLAERNEFLAHLDPIKERATIEAADDLILAVAATIQLCEERHRELTEQVALRRTRRRTKR